MSWSDWCSARLQPIVLKTRQDPSIHVSATAAPLTAETKTYVDNPRLGITLILISSLTFALMNAVVKMVSGRLGPVEIGFFRQGFSLIPVLSILARQGGL